MDVKHKTKQELAKDLNMSAKTLYRLMQNLSIPYRGSLLSPSECTYIVQRIDEYKVSQNLGKTAIGGGDTDLMQQ